MSDFHEDDVTIEHTKLADRSGYLRLTHRPSGLVVDAHLKSQPVLRTRQELMTLLRQRVLARIAKDGESDTARPALPAGGRT